MAENTQDNEEKKEIVPPVKPEPYKAIKYEAPTIDYDSYMKVYQPAIDAYNKRLDPNLQAEQDANTARSRNFWAGANLFGNVIANAINAGGTAKYAPNMTWKDDAQQKLYDDWKKQDMQLKADRKAAQDKYDALMLEDAKWKASLGMKGEEDKLKAYDTQYKADADAAKTNYGNEWNLYMAGVNDANARARQKEQNEFTAGENAKARAHQESLKKAAYEAEQNKLDATLKAKYGDGYDKNKKTIRIGTVDFVAETKEQAESNIMQVYGMLAEAYNNATNAKGRPKGLTERENLTKKPSEAYAFINNHFNEFYNEQHPEFKKAFDEWMASSQSISQVRGQGNANDFFDQ